MSKAPFVARWRLAFTNPKYGLDKLVRLVLWTISLFMAPDGSRGFPSVVVIAARAGMSARQVMRCVKIAERGGWLQRKFAGFTGKGWKHHLYVPLIPEFAEGGDNCAPRLDDKTTEGGDRQSPRYAEGGDRQSLKVVTGSHTNNTKNNTVKINNPVGAASDPAPPVVKSPVRNVSKNKSKRGHKRALPSDFVLTPALREFAVAKGFSGDVDSLFDACCDHYRGNGKKWVDWSAVWRNWVRREMEFKKEAQNGKRNSGAYGGKGRKGQGSHSCPAAEPGKYDGFSQELPIEG
jgi:hypothetical protein